jgi:hypothetical protein
MRSHSWHLRSIGSGSPSPLGLAVVSCGLVLERPVKQSDMGLLLFNQLKYNNKNLVFVSPPTDLASFCGA